MTLQRTAIFSFLLAFILSLVIFFQNCSQTDLMNLPLNLNPDSFSQTYGFHGANLKNALYRSDFDLANEGTFENPLRYPKAFVDELGNPTECIFKPLDTTEACASEDQNITYWPNGDFPLQHPGQQGNTSNSDQFWVVSLNNEVLEADKSAFHPCNSGPPNLSQPLHNFGEGVMGVSIDHKENEKFNRLFLSMNLKKQFVSPEPHHCGPYSVPFLAVGAQQNRGNKFPVAYISEPNQAQSKDFPSILKFKTEIMNFTNAKLCVDSNGQPTAECSNPGYMAYRLMLLAKFPEHPGTKMIFINLHKNRDNGDHDIGTGRQWNWPVAESFFYPGADLSFFDEDKYRTFLNSSIYCNNGIQRVEQSNGEIEYTVDLSKVYRCALQRNHFETVPEFLEDKIVEVQGVHWVLEGLGTEGEAQVNVYDMKILKYSELNSI